MWCVTPLICWRWPEILETFQPANVNNDLEGITPDISKLPKIDIKEVDTSNVVSMNDDRAMDLKKIMQLAKSNQDIYLSKADISHNDDSFTIGILSSIYGDFFGLLSVLLQFGTLTFAGYAVLKVRHLGTILALMRGTEGVRFPESHENHTPAYAGCSQKN